MKVKIRKLKSTEIIAFSPAKNDLELGDIEQVESTKQ